MMNLCIVGSRDYHDYFNFEIMITDWIIHNGPVKMIISGGARGIDTLAKRYATDKNIPYLEFPALWNEYGKSAGPIRNTQMIDHLKNNLPASLIAFPSNKSVGTHDTVRKALAANIPVFHQMVYV